MKLKLDANGNVVVQDGKPVYVKDDGSEVAFDVMGTTQTIARLNAEAKSHRERAEQAEAKAKAFDGIEDPAKAREALQTIANLDAKKLVDAGEIDKVKSEISKAFQAQLDAVTSKAQEFEQQLYTEKVGGAFARSKLIVGDGENKPKLTIPPDMVEARFGKQFSIEDGRIVAKDQHGQKIYSKSNPGELAGFDEALEFLVEQYPNRDQILRGSGASGSGAGRSAAGGGENKGSFGGSKSERMAAIKQLTSTAQ